VKRGGHSQCWAAEPEKINNNILCKINHIELHNNNRVYNELKYDENVQYKQSVQGGRKVKC
jgi:hypothetical protein